jgi:hypothetical protein
MTRTEIEWAAIYLWAKNQGISTRNPTKMLNDWKKWHPVIHRAYRKRVRDALRAVAWAVEPSSNATGEKP